MQIRHTRDDEGNFVLQVALDAATVARLVNVADMSQQPPEIVAAALLHDMLKEDEDAHLPPPPVLSIVGGTDTLN